jgi:four helix bundle protein
MAKSRDFTDMVVWQKSHRFVLDIYRITRGFPDDEKFGLVSQMRRAAVSVPANIAEGFRKAGNKDKAHFYNIAQGSLDEVSYYLILSLDLSFLKSNSDLLSAADEINRMLYAIIEKLN